MKKRLLSMLLALSILFTVLPATVWGAGEGGPAASSSAIQSPKTANPFKDISESDWYYEFVMYASENGIFAGTGEGNFEPNGPMTRGMFVTVMGRIAGIDISNYKGSAGFSDVAPNAWYEPFIAWAGEKGITGGVGDGRFDPDALIDREQMAVMLLRYYTAYDIDYASDAGGASEPADLDEVSPWARDAVLKIWKAGIFSGDDKGNFNPRSKATRAECATISTRVDKAVRAFYAENGLDPKDQDSKNPVVPVFDTYCTVSFITNGGTAVPYLMVWPGDTVASLPDTQKAGATFLGWYSDSALTEPFYVSEPVDSSKVLYAKYAELEKDEEFLDDSFSLMDQQADLSFEIKSSDAGLSAEAVKLALTLENIGSSEYVNLIAEGSGGSYTVTAEGGFVEGSSYKLALGDGLSFGDKADSFRTCNFSIEKEEVINLSLNENLVYIPSTEISNIFRGGEQVDALSVALMGNLDEITGSFTYASASTLQANDLLCVYKGANPKDRDTTSDYSDSQVAYVEVTSVSGTTVNFTSLDETAAKEVIFLPDTLPINKANLAVDEDLADGEFTIADANLDFSSYSALGLDGDTTVDVGDFLVFFTGAFATDADTSYGEIIKITTAAGNTTIKFVQTSVEAIQSTNLDYYTNDDISGEAMLMGTDIAELENQIELQAAESGFAETAMSYLAAVATQTEGFKEVAGVESFTITDENGEPIDAAQLELMGSIGFEYESEDVTVTAEIGTDTEKFGKGLRCAVSIEGEFSVDVGEEAEVIIKLSATFVEEVKLKLNANGKAVWDWWGIIPYISDYRMNANVDVYNFTGISLQAKISSAEKDDENTIIDFTEFDVSEELKKLLGVEDSEALDAGVQDLFELYGEMLETETDYISIIDYSIMDQKSWADPFCIIAYEFKVDFVVSANVNVWLGANFEYTSGTRYNFWFEVLAKKAGSSSMDLMDEVYEFQFYVMGTMGLKAGLSVEFAVGLFSTDAASVGLGAEFGAYVELYGYFIYELKSVRAAGQSKDEITTNMAGALYLEFGIYLEIKFIAQALNNKFSYQPTLYENMWPLLYAGTELNVYDYGYEQPGEDDAFVIKDIKTATLPAGYRSMAILNLTTGDLFTDEYPLNKYYYNLTNKNFTFNPADGLITVDVPEGVQYMECDLNMTWKKDKLAFSKTDLKRSVHLVWTNLTTSELKEKYTISIQAGNDTDGYKTIWSARVNKGEMPELPFNEDILTMIDYSKYTAVINNSPTNLKYTSYTGYTESAVIANSDKVYTFRVTPRKYSITIGGIQQRDGSTSNMSFSAGFGESFDLSPLINTGTYFVGSSTEPAVYTRYLTTECSNADGKAADGTINTSFATELLTTSYTYTAKYADNSCIVTYKFITLDGAEIDTATEKLAKGSIPVFDYSTHLLNHEVGYIAKEWDKPVGKVSGDTTFTAVCGTPEGDPFAVTFVTNSSTVIAPLLRYPGAAVSEPAEPVKTGYTFAGWYADEALTSVYEFARMPSEDVTIYAKWSANQYALTFNATGGAVSPDNATVTYDQPYGTLPTPTRGGYAFLGWFTELDAGDMIAADAPYALTAGQTLFAHWKQKLNVSGIDTAVQTFTYDKGAHDYVLSGSDLTGFIVMYKKNGTDGYTDAAVNAGTYSVQISRPEDEEYNPYTITLDNRLVINKAIRDVTVDAPSLRTADYTFITVQPVSVPNNDGTMMYAATTGAGAPAGGWTTSTSIGGLAHNTNYNVFAKVAGGENYEDAISLGTAMKTTLGMPPAVSMYWSIYTANEDKAGTDANVSGQVLYVDGSRTGSYGFNNSGDDFEQGDNGVYYFDINRDPWMVSGINIGNDGKNAYSGWLCSHLFMTVTGYREAHINVNRWFDNQYEDYGTSDYKRVIYSAPGFDTWGGVFDLDSTSTGNLHYIYEGQVTQQGEGQYGSYNAYVKEDAPSVLVVPSSGEYGHCYSYSNYDITLDKAAIYAKMAERGDTQLTFTATLNFPTRSTTADTATITRTITFNRN